MLIQKVKLIRFYCQLMFLFSETLKYVILITKRQNETKPYFNHTEGIETKYENHISSATDNFSVVSIY